MWRGSESESDRKCPKVIDFLLIGLMVEDNFAVCFLWLILFQINKLKIKINSKNWNFLSLHLNYDETRDDSK